MWRFTALSAGLLNKKLNANSLQGYLPIPLDNQAAFTREGALWGWGQLPRATDGCCCGTNASQTEQRAHRRCRQRRRRQEGETTSKLAELPEGVHEGDRAFQKIIREGLYALFDKAQAALDTFKTDVTAAPPKAGTGTRPRETREDEDVEADEEGDEE